MRERARIPDTVLNDQRFREVCITSEQAVEFGLAHAVIRAAFGDFDAAHVAGLNEEDIDRLAKDPRVIRNYRKLVAIAENARRMMALEKEFGSFKKYLRSHGDYETTAKAVIKEFKFMGDTGTYFFLFVVGENVPPHEE